MGQGRQQRGIRREWKVLREEYGTDGEYRAAVQQSMLDLDAIGERCGGIFTQAPLRVRLNDAEFMAVGWHFRWESYSPHLPEEPVPEQPSDEELAALEPDPEPEPVEA